MDDQTRKIVAFMVFAVVFALVGHATKKAPSKVGDATIILGGSIGAALLTLLAETGPEMASYAEGLAGVTLVSSVLINGTAVFGALTRLTNASSSKVAPAAATPATVGASQ